MVEILTESEVVESCTLGTLRISSILSKVFPLISWLLWCHMYDVLGGGRRKNGPKSPDYEDQKFVNIWFGRFLHVA